MDLKIKKTLNYLSYMALDAIMIVLSYLAALLFLRFLDYDFPFTGLPVALLIIVSIKIAVFMIFGIYNMMVNYLDYRGITRIVLITLGVNILIVLALLLTVIPNFIPKSMYIVITPIEVIFLISYRLLYRFGNYIRLKRDRQKMLRKKTIIIGAGLAGQTVLNELNRNKEYNNYVEGFLDDDYTKVGQILSNKKVLGTIDDLEEIINAYHIDEVIVAIKNYPTKKLSEIYNKINNYDNVNIRKINVFDDSKQAINIVEVNVEDLLDRDEVQLDSDEISSFIKDETILITGGGGSIGSELARQIFELEPKQLIIFDIYENNAYEIQTELERRKAKNKNIKTIITTLIGSVYNDKRLEEVFIQYSPTLIFHAAACKHVPLMEDSPREAIRTNVLGTNNLATLANKYNVKKMVLVSSDKAVRPTNVMGATKRFAELIINYHNGIGKTKFSSVRFGNVLGSNGSVVPLFKKQIADGGPVTVTDIEITRYFMTISEAVGLILQCGVYAEGGEIFILDMGSPVKIYDLAKKMIKLMGLKPYEDIDIKFVGLRPGEKLYEELLVDPTKNDHIETNHSRIFIEKNEPTIYSKLDLNYVIENYEDLTNEQVKVMLSKVITQYTIDRANHE